MWLQTPDVGHSNRSALSRSNRVVSTAMLIIAFIACFHIITTHGQQKGDEVCETLPSEIHLIKGTFVITQSTAKPLNLFVIQMQFLHLAQFDYIILNRSSILHNPIELIWCVCVCACAGAGACDTLIAPYIWCCASHFHYLQKSMMNWVASNAHATVRCRSINAKDCAIAKYSHPLLRRPGFWRNATVAAKATCMNVSWH